MELKIGKKVKVTYTIFGYCKYITGILIEEDEQFLGVRGLRDGAIFRIAKSTIEEIIELGGGRT